MSSPSIAQPKERDRTNSESSSGSGSGSEVGRNAPRSDLRIRTGGLGPHISDNHISFRSRLESSAARLNQSGGRQEKRGRPGRAEKRRETKAGEVALEGKARRDFAYVQFIRPGFGVSASSKGRRIATPVPIQAGDGLSTPFSVQPPCGSEPFLAEGRGSLCASLQLLKGPFAVQPVSTFVCFSFC